MLSLMYITNNPDVALIAENAGVDRIFVDLEYIGKSIRQGGMDTVQSHHTLDDVARIRKVITKSELLVRVNPIHDATSEYCSSEEEIDTAISNGADILMLPFFKTAQEVKRFIEDVNGRCKTMLLVETPEANEIIDDILEIKGIDECHIGLNDMSLGYHMKFMFELLANGTVDRLCAKFKAKGIKYGFGGIASLGQGAVPAEHIILEHYRLGSTRAILSRSFCNTDKVHDLNVVRDTFNDGLSAIRTLERQVEHGDYSLENNHRETLKLIDALVEGQ